MVENSEIKNIYSELQKQLFYLIPEKWDKIYLYASVEEKIKGIETGELFFYYFPKGILRKNPVNVYEVPNKFNLNEDEYIKQVEKLYNQIKKIRLIYKQFKHRLWHDVTLKIEGLNFEIEYNYDELDSTKYSDADKHIIWKYNNLNLPDEAFSKRERQIIKKYINEKIYFSPDVETYSEVIYRNPVKRIITYNKENINGIVPIAQTSKLKEKKSTKFNGLASEQRYTYKIQGKKVRNSYKNIEIKQNIVKPIEKRVEEQIERQRERVRSQILKHP